MSQNIFTRTDIKCLGIVRALDSCAKIRFLRRNSAVLTNPVRVLEKRVLSVLEMRHVIETAFLPTTCRCEIDSNGRLTLYLSEKGITFPEVIIAGYTFADLSNSRAIAEFVRDRKYEYHLRKVAGIPGRRMSG